MALDISDFYPCIAIVVKHHSFTFNLLFHILMCVCNNDIIYVCLDEYRRKTNVDERPCTSCIREKNINEILIGFN
jgi:hypothetical protein